ncbi:MAG: T9SS type A sorting domain-containing protein [Aureispira sp.]
MKHIINITTLCLLWSAISYGQLTSTPVLESANQPCPSLAIQLKSPKGNNTFYAISYCNIGNAIAENSYLEIYLDSELSIVQATHPLQYKSGNTYRFLIGDINPGACGSMYFQIPQALIKAHCLDAFAATALPCSASSMTSQTTRSCEGDDDDTNTTHDDGSFTLTQIELDLTPTGVGVGSYSDPIFEDHVFLDFVPTWDSLIRMFNNLQSYTFNPNDTTADTSILIVAPIDQDLPVHSLASYCRQQAATTSTALSHHTGMHTTTTNLNSNKGTNLSTNTLSIEEKQKIVLSPNPIQQEGRLEVQGYEVAQLQLEVFSIAGQQVGYFESNSTVLFFQTNQWNRGVYFYRLYANGQVIKSDRFIVD